MEVSREKDVFTPIGRMINICGTEFDLEHPTSIYVNCNCMDGMKQFPDKYFDLAVVDPPYGIGASEMTMGKGTKNNGVKGNIGMILHRRKIASTNYLGFQNNKLFLEEITLNYRKFVLG